MERKGKLRGVPATVLAQAMKAAAETAATPRPHPERAPVRAGTKQKVLAALKKLHPMD